MQSPWSESMVLTLSIAFDKHGGFAKTLSVCPAHQEQKATVPVPMDQLRNMAQDMNSILSNLLVSPVWSDRHEKKKCLHVCVLGNNLSEYIDQSLIVLERFLCTKQIKNSLAHVLPGIIIVKFLLVMKNCLSCLSLFSHFDLI